MRKLTRRRLLGLGIPAVLAGGGAAAYATMVEPHALVLERVEVKIAKLPAALEGMRIAVLSDFHLQPYTTIEDVRKAIAMANDLRPDLVVLLGDYVDATIDAIHDLAPELAKLQPRLGVFGVLGNHDHWKGPKVVRKVLRETGIVVLQNDGVSLPVGQGELYLAGMDSAWSGHPDLNRALAGRRGETPVVLLVHEPDFGDITAADGRVALQLSGHSHGGQVRLPGIGALQLPSWGSRYDQGLYQVRDMLLYTTRGVGLVGLPVRFNCPPEVTEITLRAGAARR